MALEALWMDLLISFQLKFLAKPNIELGRDLEHLLGCRIPISLIAPFIVKLACWVERCGMPTRRAFPAYMRDVVKASSFDGFASPIFFSILSK